MDRIVIMAEKNKFSITYNPKEKIIFFEGSLLLTVDQYKEILESFYNIYLNIQKIENYITYITLDIINLKFLNSSGISMLTSYLMSYMSEHTNISILIKINKIYSWQNKLCINLKRIIPQIEIKINED